MTSGSSPGASNGEIDAQPRSSHVHPRSHHLRSEAPETDGHPKNGRRPRRDRGTHEKLVASAREVFRAKGWHGATVDDIIKVAGVSRGSFYVYFENKQDIFERIITPVLDVLFENAGARRPGSSIFARLEQGNRAYLEAWKADPDLLRIMFEMNLDVRTNVSVSEMRRRFIVRSANALRRHQAEGITNTGIDPDFAAGALAGMVTDFARQRWFSTRRDDHEDLLSLSYQLTALWYRAVYSEAAPPLPSEAEYRAEVAAMEAEAAPDAE
jgi:AcrR family transcriptional regulator